MPDKGLVISAVVRCLCCVPQCDITYTSIFDVTKWDARNWRVVSQYFLYPATQKVAGYYVIPSELFECSSVRQHFVSVPLSKWANFVLKQQSSGPWCMSKMLCASFPCSNFSTFLPIFFKLCIDIGIGEEWYGIASGIISFRNNRVMALDLCQKQFSSHITTAF